MRGTYSSGKVSTTGNHTDRVWEVMQETYGMAELVADDFDYESATFSDGFMHAIRQGRIPVLGSHRPSFERKMGQEWHHAILNGETYVIYFNEQA